LVKSGKANWHRRFPIGSVTDCAQSSSERLRGAGMHAEVRLRHASALPYDRATSLFADAVCDAPHPPLLDQLKQRVVVAT
jgi:hypothetical protein